VLNVTSKVGVAFAYLGGEANRPLPMRYLQSKTIIIASIKKSHLIDINFDHQVEDLI
jgi:hypothetical protein